MTQTAALAVWSDVRSVTLRPAKVHVQLLGLLAACVLPAMGLVALGYPFGGARYLVGALLLCLGYQAVMRNHIAFLCLGVGAIPAMVMLRGLFLYNGCILMLTSGIILSLNCAAADVKAVWSDRVIKVLFILGVLYWWVSFLNTNEYANNLRLVELVLSAIAVGILARRRSYLATAFLGAALSTTAIALGLLPYSTIRLGYSFIDGTELGNPIQLGIPSALVLVLTLADRGQWLFLDRKFWLRITIALITGEWLILSGSRGSWVATIAALVVMAIFNRGDRKLLLVLAAAMIFVTGLALATPLGQQIEKQFDKTLDNDRTLANRTSGRSAQWQAIPYAFAESPLWGSGPGTGRNVVAYYTGRHLNWHSLYLHVLGETGLIGMTALLWLLATISRRAFRYWRSYGEIMPLLAFIIYASIAFSVAAFDATCGVLIGLAICGRETAPRYRVRESILSIPEPTA